MIERKLTNKPDLLTLAANQSGFFPALLESQSENDKIGRYDILMAAPCTELVAFDQMQLLALLKTIDCSPNKRASSAPFQHGWLVYFSYESAYFMEPKLAHLITDTSEPLAIALYCQGAVICDRIDGVTSIWAQSDTVADAIQAEIRSSGEAPDWQVELHPIEEEPGHYFEEAVGQAKGLIQSGDIYQANLSRQYSSQAMQNLRPAALFARLRKSNPAPFAALLNLPGFAVVSSSPERLLSIRNNTIETRPIAGTRPRGSSEPADAELIQELLDTPKERAEHIMLIDLGRNDIGKVCETGSVEVDELMVIESYEHVHHIVSNIKGVLKPSVSVVDAIKALFPGGTITGCPKIRCMEVIHEIEQRDRGCYTGSLGYINHDGQVDLNILIRTVGVSSERLKFNAGAGIVFDSDPKAELQETKHKAKGMIEALEQNKQSMAYEQQRKR